MANSRIYLVCKHCGKGFCLGKGYFGSYVSQNKDIYNQLNAFYREHKQGNCSDDGQGDCSDNARNHFVILEEGETLEEPADDVVPKSEVEDLIRENEILAKTVIDASELIRKLRSKLEKYKEVNQND